MNLNSTGTTTVNGGVLNFAASAGAFTLSGTNTSTISTTGPTSDLAFSAGRNITFDDLQLSAAIKLTNTASGFAATLTGGGIVDNINSFTSTTVGEGASNVGTSGTFTNFTQATPDVEAALAGIDTKLGVVAADNEVLSWDAEYPNVVVDQTATGRGKLESLYDVTNGNYYQWTTRQASTQNVNLKFRTPLPADFVAGGNVNLRYKTGNAVVANNSVTLSMKDSAGTSCGTSAASASVAWATLSLTPVGCTLTPGSVVEFAINLMDATNAAGTNAQVGRLSYSY